MTSVIEQAYSRGLDAAWRQGEYVGAVNPANPYPAGSILAGRWDDGFGDGTEDYFAINLSQA